MISTFTSPSYVNRVQESWQPGYGVTQLSQKASPTLYFDFLTGTLNSSVTFTRASTGTYFDSTGTLQSAAINAPRFDYNPSTLAAQGLLIEEARTNLLLQSGWAGATSGSPGAAPTSWALGFGTGTVTTVVSSTAGPIASAVRFDYDNTERVFFDQAITVTSGTQYAFSIYVEALSGAVAGDVLIVVNGTTTGTVNTFVTSPSVTGRYTLLFTANGNGTVFLRAGAGTTAALGGTGSITLSRPQCEAGAFATSYIPTTTTALTRNADVASVNTLSPWYNQTEGTVYAELQSLSPLTAAQSVALNKYPHVWQIDAGATDSNPFWYGVGVELIIGGTYNNVGVVPSGINKFAVSLAPTAGQSRSSLNGAAAVNRNGTLTGTATLFSLGKDSTNNVNNFLNGYLRRLTYYPRALSAAELQAITTP